jgi:hypothetical protein
MIKKVSAVVLLWIGMASGSGEDIDFFMMAQRSFSSAAIKGLGDAGIAVAGDVSAGQLNPALIYSSIKPGVGAVALGYGRDSLWGRHLVPFAIGYASEKGALGAMYRYQKSDGGVSHNGITLNLSGQMFENTDAQGSVDFGVNVRYEWTTVGRPWTEVFPVNRYFVDSTGKQEYRATVDSTHHSVYQDERTRRLIVDIGFYQPNFVDHFDFGLVVRNLAGYEWKKARPALQTADSAITDTVIGSDTIARFDRKNDYLDAVADNRGWIAANYRVFVIGAAYRAEVNEAFSLCFPVDLELFGLFNKKMKNSFVFRGGASALIRRMFIVRLGYARQPKTILEGITSFKNANVFTGGAGVFVNPVSFDFYLSQQSFGFTAGYRF